MFFKDGNRTVSPTDWNPDKTITDKAKTQNVDPSKTTTNKTVTAPNVEKQKKVDESIAWLKDQVGKSKYEKYNGKIVVAKDTCATLVNTFVAKTTGVYNAGDSIDKYREQKAAGQIHYDKNPPKGATLWFNGSAGEGGHCAVAIDNNGNYIHAGNETVQEGNITGSKNYLGWSLNGLDSDSVGGTIDTTFFDVSKTFPGADGVIGGIPNAAYYAAYSAQNAKTREWGVNAPSITSNGAITEEGEDAQGTSIELPIFSREDLEITDDMYLGSEVFRNVRDKMVDCGVGYLIYFDNVLMNRYVVNFSSTVSTSGNIETAEIELLYTPVFWRSEVRDSKTNLYESFDSIENQTNVRIFVMNIVTKKFDIVFDGDIKQKRRRKTVRGKTVVYTAKCHLDWFNRIAVPVAMPLNKTISIGDQLKWLGQGIDIDSVDTITFLADSHFKGKTLREFLNAQVQKTFLNNYLFKDSNTVAAWDDAVNRICIMGDIDPSLRAAECVDFIVSASTEVIDTMYTTIHRVAASLLIEYFSDRDGLIRVKPPYWNQPVLKDHVIDPMFIISQSDMTNWDEFYTRVIATGGNEEWDSNSGTRGQYIKSDFLTPVGVYIGNMRNSEKAFWADFTGVHVKFSEAADDVSAGYWVKNTGQINTAKNKLRVLNIEWMKKFNIVYDYAATNRYQGDVFIHTGIDFSFNPHEQQTQYSVFSISSGIVKSIIQGENTADPINVVRNENDKELWNVTVYDEATNTYIRYCHLDDISVKEGDKVNNDMASTIGTAGGKGHGASKTWHLSVEQNGKYIDPVRFINGDESNLIDNGGHIVVDDIFLGGSSDNNESSSNSTSRSGFTNAIELLDEDMSYLNELLVPSDDERRYGPKILEVTQEMIKFATSKAVENSANPAMALRRYAQFMYYMMNSSVNTAQMNVIAMPWLRPGFNVWVDPIDDDTIYYINSISYSGSPNAGVTSSLELSLGRHRHIFATEKNAFGSLKDDCDNLLISEFIESQTVDKFGAVIQDNSEFERIKESAYKFYNNNDEKVLSTESEEYFKNLYGNVNASPDAISVADMTIEELSSTGACSISPVMDTDLTALNSSRSSDDSGKRVLSWPVPNSEYICNGYSANEEINHQAIDIYCGGGELLKSDVYAVCDQYIMDIEHNSQGYIVKCIQKDLLGNGNKTMVTYAHISALNDNLAKIFESKQERRNSFQRQQDATSDNKKAEDLVDYLDPYGVLIKRGTYIGECNNNLHISFAEQAGGDNEEDFVYRNIMDYLKLPASSNDIKYDSDLFTNTAPATIDEQEDYTVSSFCESSKFFSREMSFEEIDGQIKTLYSNGDVPNVIRNRITALAARIAEADRFIERYYESEDLSMWQDTQKLSSYVAQNKGYQTNEWVEDLYTGVTTDEVTVGLTDFNGYVRTYTVGGNAGNAAEVGDNTGTVNESKLRKVTGGARITGYCACEKCCPGTSDGVTATGTKAQEGRTVAVDPSVIPYGTKLMIKGPNGEWLNNGQPFIAEDRGGAIDNYDVDIYYDSHNEAYRGTKYNCEIYIVED